MAPTPEKSEGAFRTIREVADWLTVPTHVLRFWESKFQQIAPVKGAGGRRYYRPEDMRLLGGIKVMLHDQGLTIRGVVQKIDDEGVEPLMAMSPELDMPEAPPVRTRRVIRAASEEDADEGAPSGHREATTPSDGGIRKEGPSHDAEDQQPDALPVDGQPDADPMPEQPAERVDTPQPSDDPVTDAPAPPQPVDRPTRDVPSAPGRGRDAAAPTEPVENGPGEDDDADDEPDPDEENGQLGDRSMDERDAGDDAIDDPDGDGWPEDGNDAMEYDGVDYDTLNDGEDAPTDARDGEGPVELRHATPMTNGLAPARPYRLGAIERRRLRRAIGTLRMMIEDVERELADGSDR